VMPVFKNKRRGVRLIELEWDEFEKKCRELRKGKSYYGYDTKLNRHVLVPHFSSPYEEAPRTYIYADNTPSFIGGFVIYRIKRICVETEDDLICYEPRERDGRG